MVAGHVHVGYLAAQPLLSSARDGPRRRWRMGKRQTSDELTPEGCSAVCSFAVERRPICMPSPDFVRHCLISASVHIWGSHASEKLSCCTLVRAPGGAMVRRSWLAAGDGWRSSATAPDACGRRCSSASRARESDSAKRESRAEIPAQGKANTIAQSLKTSSSHSGLARWLGCPEATMGLQQPRMVCGVYGESRAAWGCPADRVQSRRPRVDNIAHVARGGIVAPASFLGRPARRRGSAAQHHPPPRARALQDTCGRSRNPSRAAKGS